MLEKGHALFINKNNLAVEQDKDNIKSEIIRTIALMSIKEKDLKQNIIKQT